MKSSGNHPTETDVLIPAPLRPGDTVGVAAPAGHPRSDWLEAGVDFLRSHEFEVVLGANIRKQSAYLAGTDQQRADDFNAMLQDLSVRAILLARGGYGTMRILRLLDLDALKKDPIIICGMSDGTALQLYLYRHLRLVTLSGPMIAGQVGQGLDSWTTENFVEGLRTRWQGTDIFLDRRLDLRITRHGRCVGPVLGGCLSLVAALLGTHCLPDFSDAILVLEDVSEPLYRLDRMMTQLRLAGIFDAIGGLILGYFLGTRGADFSREVEQMVLQMTQTHDFPIISGFPHGHRLPNLMFAHGLTGELDTTIPSLRLGG